MTLDPDQSEGLRLLRQALSYYRSASNGKPPAGEVPQDIEFLLRVANAETEQLELAVHTIGASSEELKLAALAYIEHLLLQPEADPYRILGINPWTPADAIRTHYRLLIRLFHPDRGIVATELGADYSARINHAYTQVTRTANVATTPSSSVRRVKTPTPHASKMMHARPRIWSEAMPTLWGRLSPQSVLLATTLIATLAVGAVYIKNRSSNPMLAGVSTRPSPDPATQAREPLASQEGINQLIDRLLDSTDSAPSATAAPPAAPASSAHIHTVTARSAPIHEEMDSTSQPVANKLATQAKSDPPIQQVSVTTTRPKPALAARTALSEAAPSSTEPIVPHAPPLKPVHQTNDNNEGQDNAALTATQAPITTLATHQDKRQPPTEEQVQQLLADFITSYNRGDLENLMAILDDDIATDEPGGKAGLRTAYARLFHNTVTRSIELNELHWQSRGELAHTQASYRTVIAKPGEATTLIQTGILQFEIANNSGTAMIRAFYHNANKH